ncbi:hypothetical protein TcBrA4_0002760 [Trypanosoma cruzi]|nr:hypothetical protein TcBrA4_0002760 [Trypanosoma cruzi]
MPGKQSTSDNHLCCPSHKKPEQLQRANDSPRAPLDEPPLTKEKLESEEETAHQLVEEEESEAVTARLVRPPAS